MSVDRTTVLTDLIEVRTPIEDSIARLRQFPFDSDEELVTLDIHKLLKVLDLYFNGNLSADELEEWANAVEGRDDIEFSSQTTIDAVAELANPVLFNQLTPENVEKLADRLR